MLQEVHSSWVLLGAEVIFVHPLQSVHTILNTVSFLSPNLFSHPSSGLMSPRSSSVKGCCTSVCELALWLNEERVLSIRARIRDV